MSVSKARTFRNIIYISLTKGATLICIAVTSSVVARSLSPSDYGVVGFASIIIGFLSHFGDLSVSNAAIRSLSLDRQSLRTAFTLKIILSCIAFVAAFLIAPFAHYFFNHPATGNVIRVLAFNFLITTIGFMPSVELTREQNFRALMIPGVVGIVARSVIAVTLVLLGCKYWAVVFAEVGSALAGGITLQFTRWIPIGFQFDWEDAKEYLRFGIPMLGSGILIFMIFNLDNFLVGSRMGSTQLGYYALAFTWGSFVCGLIGDTVNNALMPAFSAIQTDLAAMRRWYLKTIDLVGFLAVVANTALLANTHFFLVTFLGKDTDKWVPAETALKILCLYGIARALTEPIGNCMMALGRTKPLFHANALAGVIEVLLLLLVLRTGKIELVAAAVLVAYVSQAIVYLPFLRENLGINASDITSRLWPVIPALVAGYVVTSFLPASLGDTIFTLGCRGLFTALIVSLVHGLCTRFRCFQEAGGMISQNLARARA